MKAQGMDIQTDSRFLRGVEHFNAEEFYEASEEFEDLFFEAVREEIGFIRVFLQISVGIHHVERNQLTASVERLRDGVKAIDVNVDDAGYDFQRLRRDVEDVIPKIENRQRGSRDRIAWPRIHRKP